MTYREACDRAIDLVFDAMEELGPKEALSAAVYGVAGGVYIMLRGCGVEQDTAREVLDRLQRRLSEVVEEEVKNVVVSIVKEPAGV